MDLQTLIPTTFTTATGRAWTGSVGDSNWSRLLIYIQMNLSGWAHEDGGRWESRYNPGVSSGTITATDTFNLPSGLMNVSNKAHDHIYILCTDGSISNYTTVPGYQLRNYRTGRRVVSVSGTFSITFSQPFASSDKEIGGTLFVPAYMEPNVPTAPTDVPQIDDIYWLVFMAAQEWAQPDVTLVQNVPSLISKANNLMTNMKLANQRMRTQSQQSGAQGAGRGETW